MQFLFLVFFHILLFAMNCSWCHHHHHHDTTCPSTFCVCNSTLSRVSCNSNGINLTYIPLMPRFVSYLSFTRNCLPNINSTTFSNLTHLRVHDLLLCNNNISLVSKDAFSSLKYLEHLDMSNNPIKILSFDLFYVQYLSLHNCSLRNSWNDLKVNAPRLKNFDVSYNLINFFYPSSFVNFKMVSVLTLNENPIKALVNHAFASLKYLKSLHLSKVGSFLNGIGKYAFNSSSLTFLDFSENKHGFKEGRFDPENIFGFLPNLRKLNVDGTNFPETSEKVRTILIHLKNLQFLRLRNVGWRNLPTGVFGLFPHLSRLYLSANDINGWNGSEVFKNVTSLKQLYLDANTINLVNETSFPTDMRKSLERLDLSYNPFSCTCYLLWFRNFQKTSNISFKPYPKHYKCISPPELKFRHLKDFNPTQKGCEKPINAQIIIAAIVSSIIGVAFVLAIGFTYKCRWHIRYGIYLLRSRRKNKGYQQISFNNDLEYDGFFIYCEEDREWVHGKLIPCLETEKGFRLCIHYRDFEVGRLIVDNIVINMDASRKLLFVLSNNFTKSQWCQFELRLAQDKFLNEGSDALVLLMLSEVDAQHINSSLRALITTTTYAAWTDEEVGQNLFWEQIVSAMQRP